MVIRNTAVRREGLEGASGIQSLGRHILCALDEANVTGMEQHHWETVACGHMNATIHTFFRTGIEERLHSLFSKWVVCIS